MIPKINNCPQYEKSKYCGKIVQASPSQCTRVLSRTCTWDELIERKKWKMSMTLQNLPKQFYKLLKKIRRSKMFLLWVQITFIFSLLCSKIMMSSEAHAQHIQSNWNEIRPETTAAWKGVPHMSSKSSEI